MHPSLPVSALFLVTFVQDVRRFVDGQSHGPSSSAPSNTLVWERRVNATFQLLQTKPCKFLIPNGNCTELRSLPRDAMNVYLASEDKQSRGKLTAVLPDKIKLVPTSYDAVVVLDPYPRASFGHPVLVFFIDLSSSQNDCSNRRSSYTAHGECITIAQKSRRCSNRLQDRRRKRRCDINFLPTVYMTKAGGERKQLLQCAPRLAGFRDCPNKMAKHPQREECQNSKRCGVSPRPVWKRYCVETCDYAVLVSGGWNGLTATSESEANVKSMWMYLRMNGFKRENIVVFVGSEYSLEIDGNPVTKDSIPAENEIKIRSQIKNFCRSCAVDTLVIYLNKPTKSNGGILVWDENNDGFAEESERYDVKELIEDLRKCKAKQVNVIADYSFAGILTEKFRSAKRHTSRGSLANVVVVASSSPNQYPVLGSFTKKWRRASHSRGNSPRCLKDVLRHVTAIDTRDFQANYESGSQELLDRTVYGLPCMEIKKKRRWGIGCTKLGRFASRRNKHIG